MRGKTSENAYQTRLLLFVAYKRLYEGDAYDVDFLTTTMYTVIAHAYILNEM